MSSTLPRLLTIEELGQYLQVSPKSIYRWVKHREIPFIKLHRHVRFDLSSVLEHFRQRDDLQACKPAFDLLSGLYSPPSKVEARSLKSSSEKKAPLSLGPKKGQDNGNN